MKQISFLIFAVVMLSSCVATKSGTGNNKEKSTKFLMKKLTQNTIDYEWFSTKAKLSFRDMTQSRSVKASIRIKKNEFIWASVTMFGIEGARALITKDSVKVISRLDKKYYIKDIKYLEETFNIPVDFYGLQDLLIGNPVNVKTLQNPTTSQDSTYYIISDGADDLKSDYYLNQVSLLLEKMMFADKINKRTVDISLQNYEPLKSKQHFSYFRDIFVSSRETGDARIQVTYSKVEFDEPKQVPFDIPKGYTKSE